jgi:hypothetical protein
LADDRANDHQGRRDDRVHDVKPETQGYQTGAEPCQSADKPTAQGSQGNYRDDVHSSTDSDQWKDYFQMSTDGLFKFVHDTRKTF